MKSKEVNWHLKIAIVRKFGSQVVAAQALGIRESRLSYIVHGHAPPSESERELLCRGLGQKLINRIFTKPYSTRKRSNEE